MNKYTTIQMQKEVYDILKSYCKEKRKSISGFVEYLVLQNLKHSKPVDVLKVDNKKPAV